MLSRLSPAHYLDQEIFARERTRLFRKLWLFAALRTALAEPDAFATRELGGLPVLLQNCDGEIRAFENLCPHRQMPLQKEAFGQARMACPYHGWVFDTEGKVKTIPHEQRLYAYSANERKDLCLKRYAVREVGNLVFVNLDADPLPFDEQFSPELQRTLADITSHFGVQAVHADLPARYNWKLNYENVLDYNHVPYIHPKTFQPLLREGISDARQGLPAAGGADGQALSVAARRDHLAAQSFWTRSPIRIEPWPWHDAVQRYGDGDFYYNFFLYPNVNFISLGGLTFLLQQFHPLAPDRTEVRFTLCAARETRRLPALPAILWGHLKSEVAVLHEDLAHLEALQSHLHDAAPRAQHGQYEDRLQSAAAAYLRLMEEGKP
ncbi:aromatic ring-hydroxylating oxygenase subunit alpha [Acidovorax sp. NCPPB 3576]|uniref:aromatic ring-hydroxylating oxygenase subunit alpha n=1 Tax=Acidovorax sp. NCPPB 3576 TaxID=2940488 RepID=UPI00234AF5D9|nr:aromatic ring-hydroxylating dioxygenase subunit alpha [Acidovorax sp. NCPPB 3576]WCM88970.1 aromatic ring-hydroxylating dioxygenase subunit alpha [Acidovorax sp. NCPPB 3576]